jgi:ubiquinone/menaquinone biosynthesis C-methylase UbiE
MNEVPEKMATFFNNRADIYDVEHVKLIGGGVECYRELACHISQDTGTILDLGCGTGLELESIFRKLPNVQLTGIDLADKMLQKLREKYARYSITLINGDYFTVDFGTEKYDTVLSVMSFHHFTHSQKLELYQKILRCLRKGGNFLECDYMIGTNDKKLEDFYLAERNKLQTDPEATEDLFHYDIPFTAAHEMSVIMEAGFQSSRQVWGNDTNVMLLSVK